MMSNESKGMLRGEYGRLPAEPNPDIIKLAIGDDVRITHRPADDLKPELDEHREAIKKYMIQEEDVLSYALFPPVAIKFFEYRQAQQNKIDTDLYNEQDKVHPV